ncbi:hypothetical protein [Pseudophaeobacter sp. 1A09344]|uniref:hypothetical protein n=1 Tax=Pseudophaeobacter sp. 1A09344 TaxID=3098144 RepID=UPI0034D567B6
MTTSTEQLNDAIAALNSAAGAYNGKKTEIDNAVAAAIAAIPNNFKVFYVDQVGGDDASPGTVAEPLASISRAVALTPRGGICQVRLASDYILQERVELQRIQLEVIGQTVRRALLLRWVEIDNQIDYLGQFTPLHGSRVTLRDIDVAFPDDPVVSFRYDHMRGFISGTGVDTQSSVDAAFHGCTFDIGASTVGSIFGNIPGYIVVRFLNGAAFTGSWEGRITDRAGGVGVDPNSVLRIINTNLSWI